MSYTPLNDSILTGDPRAVTASPGDNDTSIATTEFVQGELGNYLPLEGGTMTGNIVLDEGIDLELAADGVISWDSAAASLSYDSMDDVIISDSPIRVSSTPSNDDDLTNKAYVDSVAMGLDVKASVRVASQEDIDLSAPGANVDGVAMNAEERVLVKAQNNAEENGIYVWNGEAVAMTRAEDADSDAEVTAGMFTFVEEGTNADQGWVLTTDNPIEVGVTELAFSQFSNAVIVSTLDSLTDVDVSGAVEGSALIFDGTDWVDTANIVLVDGDSKIELGSDVNLYREDADILATDDALHVVGKVTGDDGAELTAGDMALSSDEGKLVMGAAGDVNLYREDANILATDDALHVVGKITGDDGAELTVGDMALSSDEGKLVMGAAGDVNLYREDADILATDDALHVVGKITGDDGAELTVGNMALSSDEGQLVMGAAGDVNLYREDADILATDDALHVVGKITGDDGAELTAGDMALSSDEGKLVMGAAGDVNLYREDADILATDDALHVVGKITGDDGAELTVGNMALSSDEGQLVMGAAGDVNLYREDADILATDDALHVAGSLFLGADSLEIKENDDSEVEIVSAPLALNANIEMNNASSLNVWQDRGVSNFSSALSFDTLSFGGDNGSGSISYVDGNMDLELTATHAVKIQAAVLDITAGLRMSAINSISGNTTLSASGDHIVLVDSSGGALTVTLPNDAEAGQVFQIKDAGGMAEAEPITIDGNGANIDGDASIAMGVNYQSATVIFDGANWNLI